MQRTGKINWSTEEDEILVDIFRKEAPLGKTVSEICRIAEPYLALREKGAIGARWKQVLKDKHPEIEVSSGVQGWTPEEDYQVTQTVLDMVAAGSTLQAAFKELEDKLENRSADAIGFRWNTILKKSFKDEYEVAVKKKKALKGEKATEKQTKSRTGRKRGKYRKLNKIAKEKSKKDQVVEEVQEELPLETQSSEVVEIVEPKSSIVTSDDLNQVADFMTKIHQVLNENSELKKQLQEFEQKFNQQQVEMNRYKIAADKAEKRASDIEEDYKAVLSVMDRARKLMLNEEDNKTGFVETRTQTRLKMDRNGNLVSY